MTIPEIIAIVTPAAAAFGTPIGLGLRAVAGAVRAFVKELRQIRIEFAEVRGQLGIVKAAKPRAGTGGDDASA